MSHDRATARKVSSRGAPCPALLLLIGLLAGAAGAARGESLVEGLQLDLPEDWEQLSADSAAGSSENSLDPDRIEAVWVRREEGKVTANLNLTVSSRTVEVGETGLVTARSAVKRELEAPARQVLPEEVAGGHLVRDFSLVYLGGAPAYRVEVSTTVRGEHLRQLQYLVSGRKTYVLTFCAQETLFEEQKAGFERIARSVRFERRGGLFADIPPELCGAFLGAFLGLSFGARRLRERLRRAS